MKRDVSQALGPHLDAIYDGLDTLLHTQSVIARLGEEDIQSMSKVALACNTALHIVDQIAKVDALALEDIEWTEGTVQIGRLGLVTRQPVAAECEPVNAPAAVESDSSDTPGAASLPERFHFPSSVPLARSNADTAIGTTPRQIAEPALGATARGSAPQRPPPPPPVESMSSGKESANSASSVSEQHELLPARSRYEAQQSAPRASPAWDRVLSQSPPAGTRDEYHTDDPELIQTQTTAEAARRLPLDVFAFSSYDPSRRDPRDPRYRSALSVDAGAEGAPDEDDPEVRAIFTAPTNHI
jgi:hypothetical protein